MWSSNLIQLHRKLAAAKDCSLWSQILLCPAPTDSSATDPGGNLGIRTLKSFPGDSCAFKDWEWWFERCPAQPHSALSHTSFTEAVEAVMALASGWSPAEAIRSPPHQPLGLTMWTGLSWWQGPIWFPKQKTGLAFTLSDLSTWSPLLTRESSPWLPRPDRTMTLSSLQYEGQASYRHLKIIGGLTERGASLQYSKQDLEGHPGLSDLRTRKQAIDSLFSSMALCSSVWRQPLGPGPQHVASQPCLTCRETQVTHKCCPAKLNMLITVSQP